MRHVDDWLLFAQGSRVGIDTMVWLHVFTSVFYEDVVAVPPHHDRIAAKICQRIEAMISRGIHVIPVLDGSGTIAKSATSQDRAERQRKRVEKLEGELAKLGNEDFHDGVSADTVKAKLQQAQAKITPALVDCVIASLRAIGIPYIVAPHEADHQLVHMTQLGLIDYVVTVDSDLLCHTGVKTIVNASGGFISGGARVFTPGVFQKKNQPKAGDLGIIVRKAIEKVRGTNDTQAGDEEIGAAVCLAYALLLSNDYMKMAKGFGQENAFKALIVLLDDESNEARLKQNPALLYDPQMLVAAAQKVAPKNADIDNTIAEKMVGAIAAFQKGLVYFLASDPEERTIKPLDGSQWSEDLSALGEPEPDPERSLLLALGFRCRRSGCEVCSDVDARHHDFEDNENDDVRLTTFICPGDELGHRTKLTYDMLPGSYLSKDEIKSATGNQLKRWLKCRGIPTSGDSVPMLREKVTIGYNLESETHQVDLICPDARSLIEYLIQSNQVIDIPAEYDTELLGSINNSSEWIYDQNEIEGKAPILENKVLEDFYVEKNVNASGRCKVLERGHARLALRRSISVYRFRYLQRIPDKENHCAFGIYCPRSMHADKYKVIVLCEVLPATAESLSSLSRIKQVVAVWCACVAAKGGECVHGSALLHVVRDLSRPREEDQSPTSKMCEWNRPKGKSIIDCTKPLASIPIRRAERLRTTDKRKEVCHTEGAGRQKWVPLRERDNIEMLQHLADPDTVKEKLVPWLTLVEKANEACGGEAAINLWNPSRELHRNNNYEMWRDHATNLLKEVEKDCDTQAETNDMEVEN